MKRAAGDKHVVKKRKRSQGKARSVDAGSKGVPKSKNAHPLCSESWTVAMSQPWHVSRTICPPTSHRSIAPLYAIAPILWLVERGALRKIASVARTPSVHVYTPCWTEDKEMPSCAEVHERMAKNEKLSPMLRPRRPLGDDALRLHET